MNGQGTVPLMAAQMQPLEEEEYVLTAYPLDVEDLSEDQRQLLQQGQKQQVQRQQQQQPEPQPEPSAQLSQAPAEGPAATNSTAKTMISVMVPTEARQGARIQFRLPSGKTGQAIAPRHIAAGTTIRVLVPSCEVSAAATQATSVSNCASTQAPAPAAPSATLPPPIVTPQVHVTGFQRCMLTWGVYGSSWFCCFCVNPFIAMLIWGVMVLIYFCKPAQQRNLLPASRQNPAHAAAWTLAAIGGCFLFLAALGAALVVACGPSGEVCDPANIDWDSLFHRRHPHQRFYHQPTMPHVAANFTLEGFHCPNGYGDFNNQRYIFQGHTADGRAFYRGEKRADRYVYYDRHCSSNEIAGWLLGHEPDVHRKEGLDKTRDPSGHHCVNDAKIDAHDFYLPAGTQYWSAMWCGTNTQRDQHLTVSPEEPQEVTVAGLTKPAKVAAASRPTWSVDSPPAQAAAETSAQIASASIAV